MLYFKIFSGCGVFDFIGLNKLIYLLCFEIWEYERLLIFDWLIILGISFYFWIFLEVFLFFVVLVLIEIIDVVDDVIGWEGVVVVYFCWSKVEIKSFFCRYKEYYKYLFYIKII